MNPQSMKQLLTLLVLLAISSTSFVDAEKRTRHLRRKGSKGKARSAVTSSSKGKGSSNSTSGKGKGSSCSKGSGFSSKAPSGKGKGSYSSKAPSGKGKGYSSKSPSSKGKGYSSKSPKSKGKGCPVSSPTVTSSPVSTAPTVSSANLFCAGFTEVEYNALISRATVSSIPGQPVNAQAANFVQQERFCPEGANKASLEALMRERYSLAAFYFASGGPAWAFCSQGKACTAVDDSWLTKSHVCDWYGISCDANKKVTEIRMAARKYIQTNMRRSILVSVPELIDILFLC